MTAARLLFRASIYRSSSSPGLVAPAALACAVLAGLASARDLQAQRRGDAPMAPSSVLGPITDSPTISVLGLASLPDGSGNSSMNRNELWFGATQPAGRIGNVRFAAIGSAGVRQRDAVGASDAFEGQLALRARARFGGAQAWSAVSYGRANVATDAGAQITSVRNSVRPPAFGSAPMADTSVSRRFDVGNLGRAEGGVITNVAGVELSLGFSFERATRVSTQTLTINESGGTVPLANTERVTTVHTLRALQQRDIASSVASLGFNTGHTQWLVSVTAPVATWISGDVSGQKLQMPTSIASLAVAQPVAAWLSVVGAASTNSSTVGSMTLRNELSAARTNSRFAPIVALGIRITRKPSRGRDDDAPGGILTFETRTIGAVDSATVEQAATNVDSDTLRVVLMVDAPRAESVELMGDVTEWTVTQMTRSKNGRWRAELKLSPGVHRMMVRADHGSWIAPPGYPVGNDDFGSPVGMIVVRGKR